MDVSDVNRYASMQKEIKRIRKTAAKGAKKSRNFFSEFKDFAIRGNVIDLAVGVVIGTAFSAIVNSFVKDIIMPVIGLIISKKDFSALRYSFGDGLAVEFGSFIQAIFNFIIIAFFVFISIKFINKLLPTKEEDVEEEKEKLPTEAELLTEIRDLLKEKKIDENI